MTGTNIVGVQFRRAGKIYDFNAKNLLLAIGDRVVVETERGPSLAEVKRIVFADGEEKDLTVLKPVLRLANQKDMDTEGRLTTEAAERFARDRIKELNLDMRLINAEVQFGGNKVIFYFSAPGRVDFRELVKELASGLKTRVELKQVGARDEAKQIGGIGICGLEFCCSGFLREFVPVSIKMAKNQNLALNPSKVSGGCGRLLCCLTYEDETYKHLRKKLLPKKTRVRTPDGTIGEVIKGDILNQMMQIETESGELLNVAVAKLEVLERQEAASEEDEWAGGLDLDALMGDGVLSEEDMSALEDERGSGKRPQQQQRDQRPGQRDRDGRNQQQDRRPKGQHQGGGQPRHRDQRNQGRPQKPGGQPHKSGKPPKKD